MIENAGFWIENERVRILEIIHNMIKKPYAMVGGNPKSNHIFRKGRIEALTKLRSQIVQEANK